MRGSRGSAGALRPVSYPQAADERRHARYGRAWANALDLSRRLVEDFGAVRVVAWGPLVHPEHFTAGSRVRLAVWGLRADVFPGGMAAHADPPAEIVDADHLDAQTLALLSAEGVELARRSDRQF